MSVSLSEFARRIPKAELHLHIEGTLEPELLFELAQKHGVDLPYGNIDEVRQAYNFSNLQSFLDVYYQGAHVLIDEDDFYRLAIAYFRRSHTEGLRHAEIFFDPQTHTERGVSIQTVLSGMTKAQKEAEEDLDITSSLILCFLRHLSSDAAMATLVEALPYRSALLGVGLDSSEVGHPPENFRAVFDKARDQGLLTFAHAGEEGPPEYIWQAIKLLHVERIDHGVRALEDAALVEYLRDKQLPLTVCPLSNIKLRVFDAIEHHNLKQLMAAGLMVTVNSDDPAYFGGYVGENFAACERALSLQREEIVALAKNSVKASFAPPQRKIALLKTIEAFVGGETVSILT